jgi:hypothetical protein
MHLQLVINKIAVFDADIEDGDEYSLEVKKGLSGKKFLDEHLSMFNQFRWLYPGRKRGNDTEFDNFRKRHNDWKDVLPQLTALLDAEIKAKAKMKNQGKFVPEWPTLSVYINQRRWEVDWGTPSYPTIQSLNFAKI